MWCDIILLVTGLMCELGFVWFNIFAFSRNLFHFFRLLSKVFHHPPESPRGWITAAPGALHRCTRVLTWFFICVWHLSLLWTSEAAPPPAILSLLFGVTAVWLGGMVPGNAKSPLNRSRNNDNQRQMKKQFIIRRCVAFLCGYNWINPYCSKHSSEETFYFFKCRGIRNIRHNAIKWGIMKKMLNY